MSITFDQVLHILGIVGSAIATTVFVVLFLMRQFSNNRKLMYDGFKEIGGKVDMQLDRIHTAFREHEKDDQQRHIDNLEKFEGINVHLARLNSGHPDRSTRN